jgi:hypothetical protein
MYLLFTIPCTVIRVLSNLKSSIERDTRMGTKKRPTSETATKPKNVVQVCLQHDETEDTATARTLTKPEIQAAGTIQQWQGDITDVNALADELALQIESVNNGNMKRPEAMLLSQAHTLDELFNNLARRAKNQEFMSIFETYLRLALKAQTQCRATLETLAAIKNPRVIFAKQANISSGHQQVNNGIPPTREEKNKFSPNELLEAQNGSAILDTGTTGATIAENKAMATVE